MLSYLCVKGGDYPPQVVVAGKEKLVPKEPLKRTLFCSQVRQVIKLGTKSMPLLTRRHCS